MDRHVERFGQLPQAKGYSGNIQEVDELYKFSESQYSSFFNEIIKNLEMHPDEQEQSKQVVHNYLEEIRLQWFVDTSRLATGQSFGEMALLDDTPRAATIVAIKDCYMAVLDRHNFKQCLAKIENREKNKKIDFLKNLPIF